MCEAANMNNSFAKGKKEYLCQHHIHVDDDHVAAANESSNDETDYESDTDSRYDE